MALTDHQIKQTQVPIKGRTVLTDGQGLQIRITSGNKRTWSLQYRFAGRMKKLTLGVFPAVKSKDARRLAEQARLLLAQNLDPQAENKRRNAPKITFSGAWQSYDDHHIAKLKPKTAREYRRIYTAEFKKKLKTKPLDEITKADILAILDGIDKRAPIVANRALQLIKQFFKWAKGRGYIETNPCSDIEKFTTEISRDRVLSLVELQCLLEAANELFKGNQLFVKLLLLTGQREGVIAQLRREELIDGVLHIQAARNKSGKLIKIPLSQHAIDLINTLAPKDGEFLVSNTNGVKGVSGFSKLKIKLDAISGVKNWRFHDIRRGIATALEDVGIDRFHVERILGHKDTSVTSIYARSDHIKQKKQIIETWAALLEGREEPLENAKVVNFGGAGSWSN